MQIVTWVQVFWRSLLLSLKMETTGSPETLVSVFESAQHHVSKDWSLHRTQNVTVPHIPSVFIPICHRP